MFLAILEKTIKCHAFGYEDLFAFTLGYTLHLFSFILVVLLLIVFHGETFRYFHVGSKEPGLRLLRAFLFFILRERLHFALAFLLLACEMLDFLIEIGCIFIHEPE